MADAFGKLRSMVCAESGQDALDCDIMLDNGRAEMVAGASEVAIKGDAETLHNEPIGEIHIKPREDLYVAERQGKVMVQTRDDFIEQETGLSVQGA